MKNCLEYIGSDGFYQYILLVTLFVYIANGIYKDLTDQDYLQYISNEEVIKSIVANDKVDYKRLIDIIPSRKVKNLPYYWQSYSHPNFLNLKSRPLANYFTSNQN